MKGFNQVTLIGRLTADPELHTTGSGKSVVSFGLAVTRGIPREGQELHVDFHKIVAWNGLAEFCNRTLKKGMAIFITGYLVNRTFETKTGKFYSTEVVMRELNILTWKGRESDISEPITEEVEVSPEEIPDTMPLCSSVS